MNFNERKLQMINDQLKTAKGQLEISTEMLNISKNKEYWSTSQGLWKSKVEKHENEIREMLSTLL